MKATFNRAKVHRIMSKITCLVMIAMAIISFNSCDKDDDGLTKDVHNLIPDEVLEAAKDLGLEINGGKTPPSIEGTYFESPVILINTTFNNDQTNLGKKFNDGNFIFSEQNNANLTVMTYIEEVSVGNDKKLGSLITGSGNKFSVFVRTTEIYSYPVYFFISGKIENGGIRNFQMLLLQENLQGRLFEDGDGLAERKSTTKVKSAQDETVLENARAWNFLQEEN
jgi:hypothetical protein